MQKEEITEMINILLNNNEFTIIDIETSGLSPAKGGRIIEIGAVIIKNGQIIKEYNQLINPEQKLYSKTIELTGITNEMIKEQPTFGEVLPTFYNDFIKDKILVFQNSKFDWNRFLMFFFNKIGIIPANKIIDIMYLSKYYFKEKKKHNLKEICKELNINIGNHHRAKNDAIATGRALLEFKKILKDEDLALNLKTEYANKKLEYVQELKKVKIKRIKYWEKRAGKITYQRIYVTTDIGNVYFDIPLKCWYVKELNKKINIDFSIIESKVLNLLKLENQEQLCYFRN